MNIYKYHIYSLQEVNDLIEQEFNIYFLDQLISSINKDDEEKIKLYREKVYTSILQEIAIMTKQINNNTIKTNNEQQKIELMNKLRQIKSNVILEKSKFDKKN